MDRIREITINSLTKGDFGAVLYYVDVYNESNKRYETNYIRVDNGKIDKNLHEFLEKYYKIGDYKVLNYSIPLEE